MWVSRNFVLIPKEDVDSLLLGTGDVRLDTFIS